MVARARGKVTDASSFAVCCTAHDADGPLTMGVIVLESVGLLLAGLLPGVEFVVRYGVQPAINLLDDRPHILARQALVHRLRVLVPVVIVPTVVVGIAVVVSGGPGAGVEFRWAGAVALVAFVLIAALGTVPINIRVSDWQADSPPANWKATVRRWERIDVLRSSAAIVASACFLIAVAVQIP